MGHKWIDIESIMKSLRDRMLVVSDNVYIGDSPSANYEKMKDFIVISFNGSIYDKGAYKSSYVIISLYVRDKSNGRQDVKRVDELCNKILTSIPIVENGYTLLSPVVGLGSKIGEFTKTIISTRIII